jgi:flavin reductase (DIM6/NTAB) family NADH-FMN oxidoreductase RutF
MFPRLMGELDYPMFVVTACADGERSGCLVGFTTQTSIHPARFLVCISEKNHTYPVAMRSAVLGVHLLSRAERERELASVFGEETGDEVDKFASLSWHPGAGGVPLLDDLPNRFVGRVLERVALGDHTGFLLEPWLAQYGGDYPQLSMQRALAIPAGHAP